MALLLIDDTLRSRLVHAISNTLVHSLWQGVLLALVAGIIVTGTKKKTASLRYNMLVGLLALFAITGAITFAIQLAGLHQVQVAVNSPSANIIILNDSVHGTTAPQPAPISSLSSYLNNHYTIIVLVWFLIICAKSVQLGVGLYGTYRLKYVNITPVPANWQNHLQSLAAALHVRRGIRLLQSGLAKVPLVIGHLKPVILLPAGLLTNLSTAEIEAILMHELAHVRRSDYLVNLLQSCMEVLLFFNPAVLWVSQLIKTERENCCDDLAVQYGSNKVNYIRALLNCEEYRLRAPAQAMAFPGKKRGLLQRVKRVADNRNRSLNIFEKSILVFCLVAGGVCISAFAKKQPAKQPQHKQAAVKKDGSAADTTIEKSATNKMRQPAAINTTRGAASAGDIGKAQREWATADSLANESIIGDLLSDGIITDRYNLSFKLSGKAFIVNGAKQDDGVFKRYADRYVPAERIGTDWAWSHVVTDKKGVKGDANANEHANDGGVSPKALHTPPLQSYNAEPYAQAPPPAYNGKYSAEGYDTKAYQHGYSINKDVEKKQAIILAAITDDMLRDGIITQTADFEFTLSGKSLIVNGKKLDDATRRHYLAKYRPANCGDDWSWGHSNHDKPKQ